VPVNGINVGVDYSFSYYDSTSGSLIDLGDVQDAKITAMKHDIASRPFNKPPRFAYIPDGYKIDFTIVRNVSILEDLMATLELNFNAGSVIGPGYFNEQINNADGSVSRYQYGNFVIFLTSHGDISREKEVKIVLEGMASTKIKIA
jgi:hypothetical protein